ncbi:MAG TPA: MFS transporter [Pseudonocardiaceae bacterium]
MGGQREAPATFREVFAVGEFRALWLAELLSVVGDQLARVALSVLVFQRTNSAGLTALTYALTYLPDLVGGPLLAGLADRFPRRRVMVVSDLARVVLVGCMAVPGIPIALVATLLVLARLANAPFASAQAATLPVVLDGDRYVIGQTVRQITNQTGQLVGFATGGAVVAALGPSQALAVDALTFLLSALVIGIGVRPRPAPNAENGGNGSYLGQLTAGARIIWRDRRLRTLVGLAWLAGFGIVPEGLAAPYADEIGAGAVAVGLLLAAHPAGLAAGAALLGRLVGPRQRLALLSVLPVLTLVPLLGFAFRPGLAVAMLLLFVSGACAAYHVTASATFIRLVPDAGRGQAFGLAGSGLIAAQGLGLIGGGLLVTALGSVAATIVTAGVVGIIVATPAVTAWHRATRSYEPEV